MGAMYEDALKLDRALEIFEETHRMVERKAPGYDRMPVRLREALQRKIELLKEKIKAGQNQTADVRPGSGPAVRAEAFRRQSQARLEQVKAAVFLDHI
jgi:hypothetical protein